jgi:aminopeptidase N
MGKYTAHELTTPRGQKLRIHGYGLVDKKGLEEIANISAVFLRMYEDQLGSYPFKELDIIEIPTFNPFTYFGVSPAGLVFLADTITRTGGYEEYTTSRELPALLAHELAHQWWGHKIWQASEYDNWITESLAEYQAGIALQYTKIDEQVARGKPVKGWRALKDGWIDFAKWCEQGASIEAANKLEGANAGRLRRCLLYERGPLVVHMLRSWVGDKGYFAILQHLIKSHEYGPVTTNDFAKAVSQVLKQDLQWFVDDWIKQPGTPEIKVDATVGSDPAGRPALSCKAVQTDAQAAKRLYIPIVLTYPGGNVEAKMFFVSGATAEQSFPLTAIPSKIEVDPGRTALVKYK